MPNIASNKLRVFGANNEQLSEISRIFKTDEPFNELLPTPDFKNIPNDKGVLPTVTEHELPDGTKDELLHFDSEQDLRWYEWNCENWGTKWDAMCITQVDAQTWEYETAWAMPTSWLEELSRRFPDLCFCNVAQVENAEHCFYTVCLGAGESWLRTGVTYDEMEQIVIDGTPSLQNKPSDTYSDEYDEWRDSLSDRVSELANKLVAAEIAGVEEIFEKSLVAA